MNGWSAAQVWSLCERVYMGGGVGVMIAMIVMRGSERVFRASASGRSEREWTGNGAGARFEAVRLGAI